MIKHKFTSTKAATEFKGANKRTWITDVKAKKLTSYKRVALIIYVKTGTRKRELEKLPKQFDNYPLVVVETSLEKIS